MPAAAEEEMRTGRIQRLQTQLTARGWDGVYLTKATHIRYLTGYRGDEAYLLVPAQGPAVLITDFRYVEEAEAACQGLPSVTVQRFDRQHQPLDQLIANFCRRLPVQTLAFEERVLTYAGYQTLARAVPQCRLTPAGSLLEDLRAVKDEVELALLTQAAAIANQAFHNLLPQFRPGISERKLAIALYEEILNLGGEGLSFPTILASGANGSLCHGEPSTKVLARGDFVTCDFGAVYQGYCSDTTRTVILGSPSAQQRELYELVLKAQLEGCRILQAGLTGREVDGAVREIIAQAGYGDYFGHSVGHGVGLDIHELPNLSPGYDQPLLVNQVVTVEPGVYLPGWGGVRIEDTLVVTAAGSRNLTVLPKELLIL